MAQLPSIKLISREDLGPDAPEWSDKLLYPLNLFMQAIYQALNKQLTDDNTKSQLRSFALIAGATAADNVYSFQVDYLTTPAEVVLQKVERADGQNEVFTAAPFVSWNYRNGTFNILGITGLTTGVRYNVFVKLLYR